MEELYITYGIGFNEKDIAAHFFDTLVAIATNCEERITKFNINFLWNFSSLGKQSIHFRPIMYIYIDVTIYVWLSKSSTKSTVISGESA